MRLFGKIDELGYLLIIQSESDDEMPVPEGYIVLGTRPPPSPGEGFSYHVVTDQWIYTRSIDDLKKDKRVEINLAREKANKSSFTYLGKEISCDSLSRSDIDAVSSELALTDSFPTGWPGGWKCMDNTYVPITDKATWIAFLQAMTTQGTANFLHAQTKKAEIEAATTIAEVEAVAW